jgi:undecaprenyl-diphosphatase
MWERLIQWDRNTFIYLNSLGIEEYDWFWSLVTQTTTWIPLFLLFGAIFLRNYRGKDALAMILMTVLLFGFVMALMYLTKDLVGRLRPNNVHELKGFIRILVRPDDYSFFSGHAANSFAITTFVVLLLRSKFPWAWMFYTWPLLFSLSRIYVGVHYPLDLIAGTIVGLLMAFIFYRVFTRVLVPYLGLSRP